MFSENMVAMKAMKAMKAGGKANNAMKAMKAKGTMKAMKAKVNMKAMEAMKSYPETFREMKAIAAKVRLTTCMKTLTRAQALQLRKLVAMFNE